MNDNVLIIDLEEFLDDILSYSIAGHCGPSHSCGGGR